LIKEVESLIRKAFSLKKKQQFILIISQR